MSITLGASPGAAAHVAAAQPLANTYRHMLHTRGAWTIEQHRLAEQVCELIADRFAHAADASAEITEYRRWSWSATKVRECGVRHALWADLATYAAHLTQADGLGWT